jgi:hypothetical protein
MKTVLLKSISKLLVVSLVLLLVSCSKENVLKEAQVSTNCTGTYLIIEDKAFLVCNEQTLSEYKHGDKIRVKFNVIENNECSKIGYKPSACYMYYHFDEMIRINKLKSVKSSFSN